MPSLAEYLNVLEPAEGNGLTYLCCISCYKPRIIDSNTTSDHEVLKAEEKKEQKTSKREVSGNIDTDAGGLSEQSNNEQTNKQQVAIMEDQDSYRFPLREEKEKIQKADSLCEKNRVQLTKKEEHSIEEFEMNRQFETTIRAQEMTLEIIRENEVSESSEREKRLLHENHMLWDAIAELRRELDTIKNQTQENEKKYIEEIAIFKEKNDHLQKTITETVFQHNAQLEVLRAETILVNHKLENERQNTRRLEAEVESYQSRLPTAVQDHDHCQTLKRDLQLNNEIFSQQLSKAESKSNSLEKEHRTRNTLKERTLVLERDLSQKQCQQEETEHLYEEEQGKVDKDFGKQESLQERLSLLESENMLPQQQLDQDDNKADKEENTNHELITKLQPSSSKCICLDKEKKPPQELSVEALLKRREELKDRAGVANMRLPAKMNAALCLLTLFCILWLFAKFGFCYAASEEGPLMRDL